MREYNYKSINVVRNLILFVYLVGLSKLILVFNVDNIYHYLSLVFLHLILFISLFQIYNSSVYYREDLNKEINLLFQPRVLLKFIMFRNQLVSQICSDALYSKPQWLQNFHSIIHPGILWSFFSILFSLVLAFFDSYLAVLTLFLIVSVLFSIFYIDMSYDKLYMESNREYYDAYAEEQAVLFFNKSFPVRDAEGDPGFDFTQLGRRAAQAARAEISHRPTFYGVLFAITAVSTCAYGVFKVKTAYHNSQTAAYEAEAAADYAKIMRMKRLKMEQDAK